MNRLKILCATFLILLAVVDAEAQRRRGHYGGRRAGAANAWIIGAHWSFVYSAGPDFSKVLKVGEHWHGHPYPSKMTLERYLTMETSIEISGTRNKVSADRGFNAEDFTEDTQLGVIDVNFKYRLVRFFIIPGFDPYVSIGGGVSRAFDETGAGINFGFGFNTWLANGWGFNFQVMPKVGFTDNRQHQYIQNSVGIIYRLFVSDVGKRRLERNQNLFRSKHPYQ